MTYDSWKSTNPDDQWLEDDDRPPELEGLTNPEMKQIVDAVEKARAKIEQSQDYTQDADDVMLIQYCLALGMQDLLKREAMYQNGGGWALGRVHADIARCHKLQDKYGRCFETVMRDCGE